MSFDTSHANRDDLRPITPRQAMEEWLDVIEADTAGSTAHSYRRRVRQFVQWLESEDALNLNIVDGRDIKAYRDHRAPALNNTSMKNELRTVRQFMSYGVALEAVEPALVEKFSAHIPSLTKGEASSDLMLGRERAHAILDHLDRFRYATRDHALFITMWDTGARISGLQALDLDDFDAEDGTVRFVSREESETRLKNGLTGERLNVLNEKTVEAAALHPRAPAGRGGRLRPETAVHLEVRPPDVLDVPANDVQPHSPVFPRWVSPRRGPGYLPVPRTRTREQVPVRPESAPDPDGPDHGSAEPRRSYPEGRGPRRRAPGHDQGVLRQAESRRGTGPAARRNCGGWTMIGSLDTDAETARIAVEAGGLPTRRSHSTFSRRLSTGESPE
ncbi:site-specific integrase [Halobaculum litoreum]|uniref:site-specific integrase n=1 Tax=Halobaculum litoreum TaxID=3031998 RepID=UPI0024C45C9B|nr:site-specific integrase [Halobaculum sp. DT92]